jgi:hypothetical protein
MSLGTNFADEPNFSGNEYLQLYRRIVIADDGEDGVFEPEKTRGSGLTAYLNQFSK